MKVFVRANELSADGEPTVIASYDDNTDVPNDAHGEDVTVLTVSPKALKARSPNASYEVPAFRLVKNWRDHAGSKSTHIDANERIAAVREMLELVIKHGTDLMIWPADAKARKAELDRHWPTQVK
jgi:hypothetical protein